MDTIIYCQKCEKVMKVKPGSFARRKYCPECELIMEQQGGKRGGRPPKVAKDHDQAIEKVRAAMSKPPVTP